MEIKIQLDKNLSDDIIGVEVSEDSNPDVVVGKIISYNAETGIAICELNKKDDE